MKNLFRLSVIVLLATTFSSCGYNGLVQKREAVNAQWANVEASYQRRADLIPNLVETVKGAGNYEQETLDKVISDRAKATSVHLDVNNLSQEQIDKFQSAQNQLNGSLSRLLAVSEKYPELQATQGYRDLRIELTSTEDKINFERKKFNDLVNDYNASTQTFPEVLTAKMFNFQPKGYFKADAGSESAPKVKF